MDSDTRREIDRLIQRIADFERVIGVSMGLARINGDLSVKTKVLVGDRGTIFQRIPGTGQVAFARNVYFDGATYRRLYGENYAAMLFLALNTFQFYVNSDPNNTINSEITWKLVGEVANTDTPWTDYSTLSTVVGWTSPTTSIFYRKTAGLTTVTVSIGGTSNSASTTFSLPFAYKSGAPSLRIPIRVRDNTGSYAISQLRLEPGSNIAAVDPTLNTTAWTASGTKSVVGQFSYEAN
jgi:hypothetical protein